MAIDLNINKYGAQFSAFVDFARNTRDEDTIVRVSEDKSKTQEENKAALEARLLGNDGTPRTITAKVSDDGYGKFWRGRGDKNINKDVRNLFLKTVLAVCGVNSIDDLPPAVYDVMKKSDFEADGRPLTVRRIRAVSNAIFTEAGASAHKTTAAAFVSGDNAEVVGQLQRIVATAPGLPADATPEEKSAIFAAKVSEAAAKETATTFALIAARDMVDHKGGVNVEDFEKTHYQFKRDLTGQMKFFIEGVGQVSGSYETVRDEIVRFITGDRDATFKDADASVKKQTGLLMSITSQFSPNVVEHSFNNAINAQDTTCLLAGNRESPADKPLDFSLSKAPNGDIQISFGQSIGIMAISLTENGKSKMHMLHPTRSCCVVGLEIKLPAGHLKELAEADWSKIDFERYENTANVEERLALLPDQYRLKASVNASIHYELYAPEMA